MFNVQAKIIDRPPSAEKIVKQISYGTAVGITRTVKDAQQAVFGALKGAFTLRGNWFAQNMKYGIKVKTATPATMSGEIMTAADWLVLHETGGIKKRASGNLAIPTKFIRKTPMQKIVKRLKPRALKNTFVINTSKGDVLFQRKFKGKRSRIEPVYVLEPQARIKRVSVFYEPIQKVVNRRLSQHIEREVQKALSNIK